MRWRPRWGGSAALVLAACALLACRFVAGYTEAFNWDELSLLDRVQRSITAGSLLGGGRPGLAVLALEPLVAGCRDEVRVLHAARLLWSLITALYVLGVFALLRDLLRRAHATRPLHDAALGTALLALSPVFHRWSLQVRTDQLALSAAVWGTVWLLRARGRPWLGALAGALWGTGYLASQKAVYLVALGAVLAAVEWRRDRESARAAASRAALALGTASLVAGAFYATRLWSQQDAGAPVGLARELSTGMRSLAVHGEVFGYATYLHILRSHLPHALLLGLLLVATLRTARARDEHGPRLLLAWAVLALGLAVALFHRSAFAYFWMTLGAIQAIALGVGLEAMLAPLRRARHRHAALATLWLVLLLLWLPSAAQTLTDSQAVQRSSYAFIQRHFSRADQGFQLEGGLFCRQPPTPMPVLMYPDVLQHFTGTDAAQNVEWMQQQFRQRPIAYVLGSHTLHLFPFPPELKRFWAERYVAYHGPVMVPGRRLDGARGSTLRFEVNVPGRYRLVYRADGGAPRLRLAGAPVPTDRPFELTRGTHALELLDDVRGALLVWHLPEPLHPLPELPFYDSRQRFEIATPR